MNVYLLRHGESAANVDIKAFQKYQNRDVPVTDKGQQQAARAGREIQHDIATGKKQANGIAVFSSIYKRCTDSSEILLEAMGVKCPVRKNILLSEISCGEQEGCHVEDFDERPMEAHHWDKIGPLHYRPYRGESFLDIHTRMGVFALQQNMFQMFPVTIIVGHASTCLMLHYFLTHECPDDDILNTRASFYWPNALVRKYTSEDNSGLFKYNGALQEEIDDAFVPAHAKP